jgi:hypothetical protein
LGRSARSECAGETEGEESAESECDHALL